MAELATIARPYAEALFKSVGGSDAQALKAQMASLATLAGDEQLLQYADNPKVASVQVFDLIAGVALSKGLQLDTKVVNLLRTVLDNGRLAALPEMAAQFQTLVNASSGVSDASSERLPHRRRGSWPTWWTRSSSASRASSTRVSKSCPN
jgi:F-type H+-transporting ATPase subunit delta